MDIAQVKISRKFDRMISRRGSMNSSGRPRIYGNQKIIKNNEKTIEIHRG